MSVPINSEPGPSAAVRCRHVAKRFGDVPALVDADLVVREGEVLALVGENGAGKSTLMRIVAGETRCDSGDVSVNTVVGLVRQQLSTVAGLTVLEQVALNAPQRGRINWRRLTADVTDLMESTGLTVPLHERTDHLPVSLQQRVEILSVIHRGARCLLLDEPTTYLTPREVEGLFDVIRGLTVSGVCAVFISHKLREVATFCDRISVLARGTTVATFEQPPFDLPAIGQAMTGTTARDNAHGGAGVTGAITEPPASTAPRHLPDPARQPSKAAVVLRAGGTLTMSAGEIVGIAGVAGNGQDELVETIAGLRRQGTFTPVHLLERDVTTTSPWRRRCEGIRLIPSSVKEAAVTSQASLADNLLTARADPRFTTRAGWIRRSEVRDATEQCIADYGVVATGPSQLAGELSGGNLQKFAVARELAQGAQVLVAHEPTRGVDFAAAEQIRQRIASFAAGGGGVLLLTSDLDELLGLSDRVHVLYNHHLSRSFAAGELTLGVLGELLGGLDQGATA